MISHLEFRFIIRIILYIPRRLLSLNFLRVSNISIYWWSFTGVQVTTSLLRSCNDSFQHSGQPQQWCILKSLDSSSDFPHLPNRSRPFKTPNYKSYHSFKASFCSLARSMYLSLFLYSLCGLQGRQSLLYRRFSFFVNYHDVSSSDQD